MRWVFCALFLAFGTGEVLGVESKGVVWVRRGGARLGSFLSYGCLFE